MAAPVISGSSLSLAGYPMPVDDLIFHRAIVEGKLSIIRRVFHMASPEQKLAAANLVSSIPPYLGLTPILAVLNSELFLSALQQRDEETVKRFSQILLLLIQEGAHFPTASTHYAEDSLLHFVTYWASLPRQEQMLSLLRSLKDLLLGKDPAAQRVFTAEDLSHILRRARRFEAYHLTALEFVFIHRDSAEVAEVLMELEGGSGLHNYNALLRIALQRLERLCRDPAGHCTPAYFGAYPRLVRPLLQYIGLCITHGASPLPFLQSFVCTDRNSTMGLIKPCMRGLDDPAPPEDDEPIQEAAYQSLKVTLALAYQQADKALEDEVLADREAAEGMLLLRTTGHLWMTSEHLGARVDLQRVLDAWAGIPGPRGS